MGDRAGEPERRRGNIGHVVDVFIGKQSRKVAFGVWGFLAANVLIGRGKIDQDTYLKIFFTCAALIGLGTLLDTFFEKLAARVVDIVGMVIGSRVGAFTATIEKTQTVVKTDVVPAA